MTSGTNDTPWEIYATESGNLNIDASLAEQFKTTLRM